MGGWGDGEMGRWGDGEMGRWGDGREWQMGREWDTGRWDGRESIDPVFCRSLVL